MQNNKTPARDHKTTLLRRARSKYVSNLIALQLLNRPEIDEAEKIQFTRLLFCASRLIEHENKLISHFCTNRFCLVCNRIKTAHYINGYFEPVEKMKNKIFLTLTVKNCTGALLRHTIDNMKEQYRLMRRAIKKTYKISDTGLRKIEVTYNKQAGTYHPHLHLLISDIPLNYKGQATTLTKIMLKNWLHRFPETTNIKAQKAVPARPGDIQEMFKYFTKIISKDKNTNEFKMIPAKNLLVIMRAIKGTRIFQTYGQLRKVKIEKPITEIQQEIEFSFSRPGVYHWTQYYNDWLEHSTGELLTGYKPTDQLSACMNTNGFKVIVPPPELRPDRPPGKEPPPEIPEKEFIKIDYEFSRQAKKYDSDDFYIDCTGNKICISDWIKKEKNLLSY